MSWQVACHGELVRQVLQVARSTHPLKKWQALHWDAFFKWGVLAHPLEIVIEGIAIVFHLTKLQAFTIDIIVPGNKMTQCILLSFADGVLDQHQPRWETVLSKHGLAAGVRLIGDWRENDGSKTFTALVLTNTVTSHFH